MLSNAMMTKERKRNVHGGEKLAVPIFYFKLAKLHSQHIRDEEIQLRQVLVSWPFLQ